MLRTLTMTLATFAAGLAVASSAHADTIFEVEHARAIARAGGPVSDQDAEFLERYGATTGGLNWRSRYYADHYSGYEERPYHHRRLRAYRD